jgi:glutamate dehydrogenase
LDVVETAAQRKMDVQSVAGIYFAIGDSLRLGWLRQQLEDLPVKGQWHAIARANLRDELLAVQNDLVGNILHTEGKRQDAVSRWSARHEATVGRVVGMMHDMETQPELDYAMASVALRALAGLVRSVEQ